MNNSERHIWVNGQFISDGTPVFAAESRGLMYGAGCFETFRSSRGRFLHLDLHLERLGKGMDYLGMSRGFLDHPADIRENLRELLDMNGLLNSEALIRIQVSLAGGRGYGRLQGEQVNMTITADPVGNGKGTCRLARVNVTVVPTSSRPAELKLSNTLHYMKGWREARYKGFDDALMLTVDGFVAETAIANVFWKKGGIIYTPSETCDILPGITRKIMLDLLSRRPDYPIEEGRFRPEELEQADLVWLTNSVQKIQPVTGIESRSYLQDESFFSSLIRDFDLYEERNNR
ncbi:MAG: aminotransferase class IV [Balneolaceae bacterium]